jgi:hypothetical protein
MPRVQSAALPIAHLLLRILVVANWLMGAAILALLLIAPNEEWIMRSLELSPSPEADRIVLGLRVAAGIALASVPLNHAVLKRLLAMISTVQSGDPFIAANADRLQAIAWVLLALQILSIASGLIGKAVSTAGHPVQLGAGFSFHGWLAVLLMFVLARVFAEGARMRDDLEGTV